NFRKANLREAKFEGVDLTGNIMDGARGVESNPSQTK
ncbi:MAG: pentapeptide repeat-containing protein, partial [Candidatus Thiodiazotropha taylori]